MLSVKAKTQKVIQKNTFYFFNKEFEEKYEGRLINLKETLLHLKNNIATHGLKKEVFEELLLKKDIGLAALLALTGFSNEMLKRLITIIRVVDNKELAMLTYKHKWSDDEKNGDHIKEWGDDKIERMIESNDDFRKGLVNIFFEGATIPFLASTIPLFELKKLGIQKLNFDIPEMIDTLVRYKEKGSYSGQKENNAEHIIRKILEKHNIDYEFGDLPILSKNAAINKRTMDFIIPNKKNPLLIIESSFLATTSSGQGDKAKTEIGVAKLIKKHYRDATFIGFVDGIGWYVRKQDLIRMVQAYDDVFTFHVDELKKFEILLLKTMKGK